MEKQNNETLDLSRNKYYNKQDLFQNVEALIKQNPELQQKLQKYQQNKEKIPNEQLHSLAEQVRNGFMKFYLFSF